MAWWWKRKRSLEERGLDQQLLVALLEGEKARVAANAEVEKAKADADIRKFELEVEHAEALSKARMEEREAAQRLRAQQRQWAADLRARKAAKAEAAKTAPTTCPVCSDPSSVHLTVDAINWHKAGHPGAVNG